MVFKVLKMYKIKNNIYFVVPSFHFGQRREYLFTFLFLIYVHWKLDDGMQKNYIQNKILSKKNIGKSNNQ